MSFARQYKHTAGLPPLSSSSSSPGSPSSTSSSSSSENNDLRLRLHKLLIQQKHTDCTFLVDNDTYIRSHKIILATASPVFEAMFFGPMAETNTIFIQDISADVFQQMLEFIYTDEINLTNTSATNTTSDISIINNNNYDSYTTNKNYNIEDLMELCYCAKKYLLPLLQEKCEQLIRISLRFENILFAIDLAVTMNLTELIDITIEFFQKFCLIGRFFSKVIVKENNHQHYYHISKNCLNLILASAENYKQNINLICLLKKWCQIEELNNNNNNNNNNQTTVDENIRKTLNGIDIPENIINNLDTINSLNISDGDGGFNRQYENYWFFCERKMFKAVRPLVIGNNGGGNSNFYQPQEILSSFKTSIKVNRFAALGSLYLNSRLTPTVRTCSNISSSSSSSNNSRRTPGVSQLGSTNTRRLYYTENLLITVRTADERLPFEMNETFIKHNVPFNSNMNLTFENPIMLTPNVIFIIEIKWIRDNDNNNNNNYCSGWEYPRNILSHKECVTVSRIHDDKCIIEFDCHLTEHGIDESMNGSILSAIECLIFG